MVLAQAFLEKFGGDSLGETKRNYRRLYGTGEEFLNDLSDREVRRAGARERRPTTVTEFDTPELHKLIDDMFESMYAAKGVGLAAPQIGIAQAHRGDRYHRWARIRTQKIVLINPEIIKRKARRRAKKAA